MSGRTLVYAGATLACGYLIILGVNYIVTDPKLQKTMGMETLQDDPSIDILLTFPHRYAGQVLTFHEVRLEGLDRSSIQGKYQVLYTATITQLDGSEGGLRWGNWREPSPLMVEDLADQLLPYLASTNRRYDITVYVAHIAGSYDRWIAYFKQIATWEHGRRVELIPRGKTSIAFLKHLEIMTASWIHIRQLEEKIAEKN